MKKRIAALVATVMLFGSALLVAAPPELEAHVLMEAGGSPINVVFSACPLAIDWNNDGAKDLLVGQLGGGYLWLYLNSGTNLNPVLDAGTYIMDGANPLSADGA